jgi:hypothetical protein
MPVARSPVERVPFEVLPRSLHALDCQAWQRRHGIIELLLIDLYASNAMPSSSHSTFFAAALG